MEDTKQRELGEISELLTELYGPVDGDANFQTLKTVLEEFLSSRETEKIQGSPQDDAIKNLAGKVFAICYPDNVYDDSRPTLRALEESLSKYFPHIGGIHILPERLISHDDVWPQDMLGYLTADGAKKLLEHLLQTGLLDAHRHLTPQYAEKRDTVVDTTLSPWVEGHSVELKGSKEQTVAGVSSLLEGVFTSHFNDGGFSQRDRSVVDPRFGSIDDIRRLSERFLVMLDYVVNHLDIDNEVLERYRRGEDDGRSFVIVRADGYRILRENGTIAKTFRPRPFPLFTGMRKYPLHAGTLDRQIARMNKRFEAEGLKPLDPRLVAFLKIYFKVENDQGLTAADSRIFADFHEYLKDGDFDPEKVFKESSVQPQQLTVRYPGGPEVFLPILGLDERYGFTFNRYENLYFGEKFFVYTTFSESQVDINPTTRAGFSLVIRDLFALLSSGNLAMLRMDAIKYLWKEVGRRNFDLGEGNKLIEIIRRIVSLASPGLLPLDEVNSPDPVVYQMCEGGGFAYLFGQVNAVPAAFNAGSLEPIVRFRATMEEHCPSNLLLFTMLSTHDGRSVQGLGVDRSDGHVSITQFYDLIKVVEVRGGKPKYRSVPVGSIPGDTLRKICSESGMAFESLLDLFDDEGDTYSLKDRGLSRDELLSAIGDRAGKSADSLAGLPAVNFFLQWIIDGQTPYELCCTSRCAFSPEKPDGKALSPIEEARRLALGQIYVLTLGQAVPAVYFNDLLGLENDFDTYKITGKPRDLNRHKNYLPDMQKSLAGDDFTSAYVPLINAAIEARAEDTAFMPGSADFEFKALTDTIFLNHPYADGNHSFILGNILPVAQKIDLDVAGLAGVGNDLIPKLRTSGLRDALTGGDRIAVDMDGKVTVNLGPYGAVWLKA